MASTVTLVATEEIDGIKHLYYTIADAAAGVAAMALIPAPSVFCTVTLIESKLTTAGSASTVQPALGVGTQTSDFVSADRGPTTAVAAASVRNTSNQHMIVPDGSFIIWRPNPDNTATLINSRVVVREGHI